MIPPGCAPTFWTRTTAPAFGYEPSRPGAQARRPSDGLLVCTGIGNDSRKFCLFPLRSVRLPAVMLQSSPGGTVWIRLMGTYSRRRGKRLDAPRGHWAALHRSRPSLPPRVRRMERDRIIRSYRGFIRREALGAQIKALILIQLRCKHLPEVVRRLRLLCAPGVRPLARRRPAGEWRLVL